MPDQTRLTSDGLPIASSKDAWDRMSDEEKATILAAHEKTWRHGGSGAVPTSPGRALAPNPAPPVPPAFDADDRRISGDDWQPSPEQLEGIHSQAWK